MRRAGWTTDPLCEGRAVVRTLCTRHRRAMVGRQGAAGLAVVRRVLVCSGTLTYVFSG